MMKFRKPTELSLYFSDASIGFFKHHEKKGEIDIHGHVNLEKGILENGYVADAFLLYARLKALFKANGIRPSRVRLVLNSQNILMRVVDVKREDIRDGGIAAYLDGELGKTIHFPFPIPRVSYHIISQEEKTIKILAVASDDRFLNDYLDIFDKLGVKDVAFDMPAFALYSLFSNTVGVRYASMMLVTVYDTYFTIKIFEADIPIFNLVEEFENETDTRHEQVVNYVERVANYYRYNIGDGEKTIEKIVFVSQSEQETETQFAAAIKAKALDFSYEIFRIPEEPNSGGGWNRTSLVAYAASLKKTGNLEKISRLDFQLQRPLQITRIIKLMFAVAFFLFSALSLLYIPYHTLQEELTFAQNRNDVIAFQLLNLETEIAQLPSFNEIERAYSNAYDALIANKQTLGSYLRDLSSRAIDVDIVSYSYFAETKELICVITGPSSEALMEYLLDVFETYGMTDVTDAARWITAFPTYQTMGTNRIEVIFYHA